VSTYAQRLRNRMDPVEPEKAKITVVDTGGSFPVQFNPTTLGLRRKVTWADGLERGSTHGSLQFAHGSPDDLDFTLFLDETEYRPGLLGALATFGASTVLAGLGGSGAGGVATALVGSAFYNDKSVLATIDLLFDLTRPLFADAKLKTVRPPLVEFAWKDFVFRGVIEALDVDVTVFEFDGTPKRATVKVSMKGKYAEKSQGPSDFFAPVDEGALKMARQSDLLEGLSERNLNAKLEGPA
jgi:hypothetical protein